MPQDVLAAWSKAADHVVLLPSGMLARVRIPEMVHFVTSARLPDDLRPYALAYVTTSLDASAVKPDDAGAFMAFCYALAAETIRALAPKGSNEEDEGAWQSVRLTGPELQEADIPQEDLHAILMIANRRQTPNDVSMRAAVSLGLDGVIATAREAAAEAGGRVSDFAPFRGESGSSDSGASGAAVRAEAIRPSRDQRRRDRVRD
jgi:hypothetical protein